MGDVFIVLWLALNSFFMGYSVARLRQTRGNIKNLEAAMAIIDRIKHMHQRGVLNDNYVDTLMTKLAFGGVPESKSIELVDTELSELENMAGGKQHGRN